MRKADSPDCGKCGAMVTDIEDRDYRACLVHGNCAEWESIMADAGAVGFVDDKVEED
jgi:hypothetical protein